MLPFGLRFAGAGITKSTLRIPHKRFSHVLPTQTTTTVLSLAPMRVTLTKELRWIMCVVQRVHRLMASVVSLMTYCWFEGDENVMRAVPSPVMHHPCMHHIFSSTRLLRCSASLSRLSEIEVDVLELKLSIKCLKKSIGLQRNLNEGEYAALFKGADLRIDTKYVKIATTLKPFTRAKSERKLKEFMLEKENAVREERKAATNSPTGFKMCTVVEAALPSTSVNPMGMLPDKVVEVAAVKISSPYFENIPSLYIRMRYYPPLWEDIKNNFTASPRGQIDDLTIVIGQPGIGKSVGFGNYCVLRCMMDLPKTIVIVITQETVNVLVPLTKGWKQFTADTSALHSLSYELCALVKTLGVGDHNALVVHDLKSAKGFKSFPFQSSFLRPLRELVVRVHTVILTSPQQSNYGMAMKAGAYTSRYLPVWSIEELECIKSFDVQKKYEYCGGIPRSYGNSIRTVTMSQKNASLKFDPTAMNRLELSDQCPSELVKLDIGPDFDEISGLSPVSMSAERLLRQSFFNGLSHYHHIQVQRSKGTEKGLELERWFLFWIRGSLNTAITCDIKNLADGAKSVLTINSKYYVEAGGNTFQGLFDAAKRCSLQIGQSVLIQPKSTNFPVVDLLLFTRVGKKAWVVDAFQVTVSPSHSPKKTPADELIKCFAAGSGCTLRHFVWVGLTAVAWSADPNCGVTQIQKVSKTKTFFEKQQFRLDMMQLVPKTSMVN